MASRPIVRDPNVLGGRWRFEGTSIPIGAIRSDYLATSGELLEQYRFAGLTAADIEAALEFDFPGFRDVRIEMEYAAITVNCPCGEDTHAALTWPIADVIECVCRRRWRIAVLPVHEDGSLTGSSDDGARTADGS